MKRMLTILVVMFSILTTCSGIKSSEVGRGEVYSVVEISFNGPVYDQTDTLATQIDFWVRIKHESGAPTHRIHGFWESDGYGGRCLQNKILSNVCGKMEHN